MSDIEPANPTVVGHAVARDHMTPIMHRPQAQGGEISAMAARTVDTYDANGDGELDVFFESRVHYPGVGSVMGTVPSMARGGGISRLLHIADGIGDRSGAVSQSELERVMALYDVGEQHQVNAQPLHDGDTDALTAAPRGAVAGDGRLDGSEYRSYTEDFLPQQVEQIPYPPSPPRPGFPPYGDEGHDHPCPHEPGRRHRDPDIKILPYRLAGGGDHSF